VKGSFIGLATVALLISAATSSEAAVGTTCVCRAADGKTFQDKTFRHHRWACDHKYGYAKSSIAASLKRPTTETCNDQEIAQFKAFICVSNGCSYGYVGTIQDPNKAIQVIAPMTGKRTP
jgi:hypothetical protein